MDNISGSYIALIQDRETVAWTTTIIEGVRSHTNNGYLRNGQNIWKWWEARVMTAIVWAMEEWLYSWDHIWVILKVNTLLLIHTLVVELEGFHLPSTPCKVLMCMTLCFTMMTIMKTDVNSWKLNSKNVCCFPFRSLLRYKNFLYIVFITQCKKMCKPKMNVWFWQQCLQNHSSTENSRSIS